MKTDPIDVATIVEHFLIAAVWADSEEGTNPRVSRAATKAATEYVTAFTLAHADLTRRALACEGYGSHHDAGSPEAAFGHDLWLTARGHGTGFWDRAELGEVGDELADVLRTGWHVEFEQWRGWVYLTWAGK